MTPSLLPSARSNVFSFVKRVYFMAIAGSVVMT